MHPPLIRPATEADLERLVAVEVDAGQAFRSVGMAEVARTFPGSLIYVRQLKQSRSG